MALNEISKAILGSGTIDRGDKVLIALSGGPDSIALLTGLIDIRDEMNLSLYCCHLEHGFRDEESVMDMDFCLDYAGKLGISILVMREDVAKTCKLMGKTLEEGARDVRYDLFRQAQKTFGCNKIAIAQNKDDQCETILMKFLRGAGTKGLGGITAKRDDGIVRPILDLSKKIILNHLKSNQIPFRVDSTNLKPIYQRNRVRLELLPYIREYINPNIDEVLIRSGELFRDIDDYLSKVSLVVYNETVTKINEKFKLNVEKLLEKDDIIKSNVIVQAISELDEDVSLSTQNIKDILSLINSSEHRQIDLPMGYCAYREYESVYVGKASKALDYEYLAQSSEGTISLPVGDFKLEIIDKNLKCVLGKFSIVVDFDKLGELTIRNRRDGDRFRPLGLNGSKKLKDYFIDSKVPKELRGSIPILISDGEIVWVVGYRQDERFLANNSTSKRCLITYKERV